MDNEFEKSALAYQKSSIDWQRLHEIEKELAEAAEAERDKWYDNAVKERVRRVSAEAASASADAEADTLRAERDAWVNKFEDLSGMTGAERRLDRDRIHNVTAERDALRTRAEAAEADKMILEYGCAVACEKIEKLEAERDALRKVWQSADTTAQALSMNAGYIDVDGLRVGVHMVRSWLERMRVFEEENETLRAEHDALRKDAERLDWLESARHVCLFFDVDTNSYVTTIHDGVDGARAQRGATAKTIRAALDAALAVQPKVGEK